MTCRQHVDDVWMTCGWCEDDMRVRLGRRFGWQMTYVICMSSTGTYVVRTLSAALLMVSADLNYLSTVTGTGYWLLCRWHESETWLDLAGGWHMSSTHCPHIICRHVCHLHVIYRHICHPHVVCSTPHGQHGLELSFYCDMQTTHTPADDVQMTCGWYAETKLYITGYINSTRDEISMTSALSVRNEYIKDYCR